MSQNGPRSGPSQSALNDVVNLFLKKISNSGPFLLTDQPEPNIIRTVTKISKQSIV
jgi:hypothetical protein